MENKGTKKIAARIVDENDSEWYGTNCQFLTQNQDGVEPGTGNYMQVDGGAVLTNGISTNQKTHFTIHSIMDDGHRKVVILENKLDGSVVAIKRADNAADDDQCDSVIAKALDTPLREYNNLEKVRRDYPEILFYQEHSEPGSDFFYFKSCLTDENKQWILGFDANGIALDPTQVQSTQKECLFSQSTV